ncbi:MAG: hypothetical protein AAF442_08845 [Pseudomonadota bacterium]
MIVRAISHDLAGPLGAIRNGLELLDADLRAPGDDTDGNTAHDMIDLMGQAIERATAQLAFVRLAYTATAPVTAKTLRSVIDDYVHHLPITITLPATLSGGEDNDIPAQRACGLLIALKILARRLPRGGKVTLIDEGYHFLYTLTGNTIEGGGDRAQPDFLWLAQMGGTLIDTHQTIDPPIKKITGRFHLSD